MFASEGMHVCRLLRVAIGPISLQRLPAGSVRELSRQEVQGPWWEREPNAQGFRSGGVGLCVGGFGLEVRAQD